MNNGSYIRLAEEILKSTASEYETVLEKVMHPLCVADRLKNLKRMDEIEKDLMSDYYAILTLGALKPIEYINHTRLKHGLPRRKTK